MMINFIHYISFILFNLLIKKKYHNSGIHTLSDSHTSNTKYCSKLTPDCVLSSKTATIKKYQSRTLLLG